MLGVVNPGGVPVTGVAAELEEVPLVPGVVVAVDVAGEKGFGTLLGLPNGPPPLITVPKVLPLSAAFGGCGATAAFFTGMGRSLG